MLLDGARFHKTIALTGESTMFFELVLFLFHTLGGGTHVSFGNAER